MFIRTPRTVKGKSYPPSAPWLISRPVRQCDDHPELLHGRSAMSCTPDDEVTSGDEGSRPGLFAEVRRRLKRGAAAVRSLLDL